MMISLNTIKSISMTLLFALLIMSTTQLLAENKQKMTLEEAAEFVRKTSNGKILSARTTKFNGESSHRIQVLTPTGRVKIIQVPIYKFNSSQDYDSNNYRDSTKRNESKENYRSQRDTRPSRYQKPNYQNNSTTIRPSTRPSSRPTTRPSTRPSSRPNNRTNNRPAYQKPRQPNVKQEKSGNRNK